MKKVINIICIPIAIVSFLVFVGEVDNYTAAQTLLIKSISFLGLVTSIKTLTKEEKEK